MSVTKIKYEDIAPNAREEGTYSETGAVYEDIEKLITGTNDVIANLDLNRWVLDGSCGIYDDNIALWSGLGNSSGTLSTHMVVTVEWDENYSSTGITLVFGDGCMPCSITWYNGATVIASDSFVPNASTYFCDHQVSAFDKIVIDFNGTALPNNRGRLQEIIFGMERIFTMDELRNVSVSTESDLSSTTIPISSMKFNLDSMTNTEYSFQTRQKMSVYNGTNLFGTYYVSNYKRKAENLWEIECEDAIGVIDGYNFAGAVYTNQSAESIVSAIIGNDFELDIQAEDVNLTGIIQASTKRDALHQVLLAWCCNCSTDGTDKIRIYKISSAVSNIPKERTFYGVTIDKNPIVTAIRLVAHSYTQDPDGDIEIGGVKYKDTQTLYTKTNPSATANDKANVIEITDATLVSLDNAQTVLQFIYTYYLMRSTVKAKYVWDGEKLGQYISQSTEWDTSVVGYIQKITFKLSNKVVVEAECCSTGAMTSTDAWAWRVNETRVGEV